MANDMGPIHVVVTQEDIEKGIKGDTSNCPIANALKRMGYTDVKVGYLHSWIHRNGRTLTVRMPIEASFFVDNFDNRETVAPFSFDLKLEKESIYNG